MKTNSKGQYNIRVYGIYIKNNSVLVSDEFRFNTCMTKFPGGGLEKGEGLADCILRECREEFNQEFKIINHYYTTDFYIESAFHPGIQLLSIYYMIDAVKEPQFKINNSRFDFEKIEGAQSFRWISLKELRPDHFTYPVDQLIAKKLQTDFG